MPKLNILCTAGSLCNGKELGNQVKNLDGRATVSGEHVSTLPLGFKPGKAETGKEPQVRKPNRCAARDTFAGKEECLRKVKAST